ncbi:MAG: DUF3486 family protein [Gemmatimonadota bacterium]|nr:DUF3486 family protein [Gemmatimonadota bacterium]
MPQPSRFDQHFSQAEQAKLAAWIDEHPTISVDDFRELLSERGLVVGRTTAFKEKKRIEKLGERLRRSRALMDQISETLEGRDDSSRMRAILEASRVLVFELQEAMLTREEVEVDAKELMMLNVAIKDLAAAARGNQQFGEAERRKILQEASEAVAKEAKALGLSDEVMERIDAVLMPEGA